MKNLSVRGEGIADAEASSVPSAGGGTVAAESVPRSNITRRKLLMAVGGLAFSEAGLSGCDDAAIKERQAKEEQEARKNERIILNAMKEIKTEYRNVRVNDYEEVVKNADEHIDVIYEAAYSMLIAAALIKTVTSLTGICISNNHLVLAIKSAQDLLDKYAGLESSLLKESIKLQKRGRHDLKRYVVRFDAQHRRSRNEIKEAIESSSEFESFVAELTALAWVVSKTKKERDFLLGNSRKCGEMAVSLSVLADAMETMRKAITEVKGSLEELGCNLPPGVFSNSAFLNFLAGDVMGEKRKEAKEAIGLAYELKVRDEREDDVKKLQRFLVDYEYMPDDEPYAPAINGSFKGKTVKCAHEIQWMIHQGRKWSRLHCAYAGFKTAPNGTVKRFQYVLISLGFMDASYKPEGIYDAETNAAFLKFEKYMFNHEWTCD